MKAVICTKYGPPEVLQLKEVAKPIPKNNEILIKIYATSVTASDTIVRGFKIPSSNLTGLMMGMVLGFKKPRNPILGMVFAGEIESIGQNVRRFNQGEQVYGWTIKSGLKMQFGTYAEYISLSEDGIIALKPVNLNYVETAAIPYGGMLALHYVGKGNIQKGQKVLIYGASGAIGTIAIQLAKYYDAEVTGVCSTPNLELVKSLGADKVVDYTKENIWNTDDKYDFILDAVPFGRTDRKQLKHKLKMVLNKKGKYISVDDGSPKTQNEGLILLNDLVEAGRLRPVIDKIYPLEQIVEAHRHVDSGHKKGNVIISVKHNN